MDTRNAETTTRPQTFNCQSSGSRTHAYLKGDLQRTLRGKPAEWHRETPFQPGDNHNCLSCERRNAYLQSDNYRTAQA